MDRSLEWLKTLCKHECFINTFQACTKIIYDYVILKSRLRVLVKGVFHVLAQNLQLLQEMCSLLL